MERIGAYGGPVVGRSSLPAKIWRLGGPHSSVGYPNSMLAGERESKRLFLPAHLSELLGEIDALLEHVTVYLWILDQYLVFGHWFASLSRLRRAARLVSRPRRPIVPLWMIRQACQIQTVRVHHVDLPAGSERKLPTEATTPDNSHRCRRP